MDAIFTSIGHTDEHMNAQEPYKKIKNPETADQARVDIAKLVQELGKIAGTSNGQCQLRARKYL